MQTAAQYVDLAEAAIAEADALPEMLRASVMERRHIDRAAVYAQLAHAAAVVEASA